MSEQIWVSLPKAELENIIENSIRKALTETKKIEKERELLNADQLCKWLGISLSTLNKWKAENKIPFKKLGKRVFFQKAEILKALKESNYHRLKELGA